MALVITEGHAQIIHRYALAGDPEEMMFTYGVNVGERIGPATNIAVGERDRWLAAYPPAGWSDQWVYRGVKAYVGAASGPPTIQEAPSSTPGTTTIATPPQNCCVLVRKQSAVGGRANRGRLFMPPFGLSEANVSANGMLDPDFVADVQDIWDSMTSDFGLVILHDSTSPGGTVPTAITTMVVDGRIATQRRRLR